MKIRYVGPFDAVEVPVADGRFVTVARDEVVDLPVAIAGRPPAARLIEILDELPAVAHEHAKRVALLDELASLDADAHGAGLLAQHTTWQAVKADKKESDQ